MTVSASLPLTVALEDFALAAREPPDEAQLDLAVATVRVLSDCAAEAGRMMGALAENRRKSVTRQGDARLGWMHAFEPRRMRLGAGDSVANLTYPTSTA